ncbi:MAG: hypothetical protein ACPGZP_07620 [Panacagrimonas sp.]
MDSAAIWLIIGVVAMLVGPFATLKAMSHLKSRKRPKPDDAEPEEEDKSDFW